MKHDQSPENPDSSSSGPPGPPARPKSGVRLAEGVRVDPAAIQIGFVRSSGPGGQNVNKRSTKAQLRIRLDDIPLPDRARGRLERLARRTITTEGELLIEADETRSQSRNRRACMDRLRELIVRAMIEPKQRRKTKPSKGSIRCRIEGKKRRGEIKRLRKPPKDQ